MATYTYNGKVLIQNSKREDYRFAYINKNTLEKLSISSTATGASKEFNNLIRNAESNIANYKKALVAIDFERSFFLWKDGRYSEKHNIEDYKTYSWISEEEKALSPREYYTKQIEDEKAFIERVKNTYILVEVEKA